MQTQSGKTFRNDRIIAVADAAHQHGKLKSMAELDSVTIDEIEHFFISYNEMRNRKFKPIRRGGADSALRVVRRGIQAFKNKSKARNSK